MSAHFAIGPLTEFFAHLPSNLLVYEVGMLELMNSKMSCRSAIQDHVPPAPRPCNFKSEVDTGFNSRINSNRLVMGFDVIEDLIADLGENVAFRT